MVKQVKFTDAEPKVHHFDPYNGYGAPTDDTGSSNGGGGGDGQRPSQLTEEMTLLSTLHGRARRQLRDISKHDLKTVIKYGTKTTGRTVNGERRWMFEHGNTVVITDYYCQKEVTSYNKAIEIERATITQQMMDNHNEAVRLMRDDPHMCATHSIIIIDQSASMKTCDVNCFRSRSDASYGTLALDYIAQQLYQMADEISMDAVTIIEMHDEGTVFVDKEPLDWILFNKVLDRPSTSKPRSHGNYVKSLEVAQDIINSECELFAELDADDIPAFSLVLISDGKPSDTLPEHEEMRLNIVTCIAKMLKSKLTVCGMGIGACGSDFEQLKMLVDKAIEHGSEGQFNHAGLNPANLSTTFSSIATSMTTKRNDLCSITGEKLNKTEKSYQMRQKKQVNVEYAMQKETSLVRRSVYDHKNDDWKEVDFLNHDSGGFAIEKNPFGKGAERLAYMFQEIKLRADAHGWEGAGERMVAKESKYNEDERSKLKFHLYFCRAQTKAQELAELFNAHVMNTPLLVPSEDELSLPPPITFLDCSVYEYTDCFGDRCGLLVEKYLKGKFTKFNNNNGYVCSVDPDGASIHLAVGEILLTDFVQAFSHWVYESTEHELIVCDLQGILDMEGRRPVFRLTDPAICSRSRGYRSYYGKTDLGMKGIRKFCMRHCCNHVCSALNLPPTRGSQWNEPRISLRRETNSVRRFVYDPDEQMNCVWKEVQLFEKESAGFQIELSPFGKGADRLAYKFHEIKPNIHRPGWRKVGERMVAKESKLIVDERYKEQFHLFYCRVQSKAQELAKLFNETVANTPVLGPRPPSITFLDCSIYEYTNAAGVRCGVLVENFLRGRFTKFNFNNGVAHTVDPGGASDFVQAFSHWVYETTKQKMIVCGLQGVFDCHDCLEPIFRLTDPAIYSRSRHGRSVYGRKDLGRNGIRSFCMSHCCNRVCSALKLPSLK